MNLFFLEYNFAGKFTGLTKKRSFFYRPEFVADRDLWNQIKAGKEIMTLEEVESSEELDKLR